MTSRDSPTPAVDDRTAPPVTVGMPVYNGIDFIERALAALLEQTYRNFTLLVSDNASDDGTWELLQDWAGRDQRIVLQRHESNIGPMANFRYVLDRAETEYFMWHAHDDWLAPNYLEELFGIITAEPGCALACAAAVRVASDGRLGRRVPFPELAATSRLGRITKLLSRPEATWIYGLFRTAHLRRAQSVVEEFGYVWCHDRVALLPFVLDDRVRGTNRTVFHNHKSELSVDRYRPNSQACQMRFVARYLRFHLRIFRKSGLSFGQKLLCWPWLLGHLAKTTHLRNYKRFIKHPAKRLLAFVAGPIRSIQNRS